MERILDQLLEHIRAHSSPRSGCEELFTALSAATQDAILIVSSDGRLCYWNQAAVEIFGYEPEEVLGKSISRLLALEPVDRALGEGFTDLKKTRDGHLIGRTGELCATRKDGQNFSLEMALCALEVSGGSYSVAIVSDTTLHRETQKALQLSKAQAEQVNAELEEAIGRANHLALEADRANRAKSAFLANMSHEIRTPMNAIVGFTEMLLDNELTDEQRSSLEMISDGVDTLVALVDDILDLSKIEAGRMDLEEVPFDLENLVFQTLEMIRAQLGRADVELLCDIDPPGTMLRGDPTRLRQILLNLLSNAVKFTKEGEIVVRVGPKGPPRGDRLPVVFEVQDTGIGIDQARLDSIFEPFSQADCSISRNFGGTGLGLAITRKLVQLMGGEIAVTSAPQRGSTFRFEILLGRHQSNRLPAQPPSHPSLAHGARILVVDDNASARDVMKRYLERLETRPSFAEDLPQAAAQLRDESFDVVIAKINVSDASPDEIAQELLKNSRGDAPEIIALSDQPRALSPLHRRLEPYCGYLTKPFRLSDVAGSIDAALGKDLGKGPKKQAPGSYHRGTRAQVRILLGEDHAVSQQMMQRMLLQLGHDVEIAEDGVDCLQKARDKTYDLILLDIQMPRMSGIEVAETLRAQGNDTPIFALTANAMKSDRERCLEAGMNDYISKPVKRHVLQTLMKRHLGVSSTLRQTRVTRLAAISSDPERLGLMGAAACCIPSASVQTAVSAIEAYINIGAHLPDIAVIDTDSAGVDVPALVTQLDKSDRYHSVKLVLLGEEASLRRMTAMVDSDRFIETIATPLEPDAITRAIKDIVENAGNFGRKPAVTYASPYRAPASKSGTLASFPVRVDAIARSLELTTEETLTLLRSFVSHNGPKIAELFRAARDGDTACLRSGAHLILGSAVNLRLERLGEIARRIEDRAHGEDIIGIEHDLDELGIAFEAILRITGRQDN